MKYHFLNHLLMAFKQVIACRTRPCSLVMCGKLTFLLYSRFDFWALRSVWCPANVASCGGRGTEMFMWTLKVLCLKLEQVN